MKLDLGPYQAPQTYPVLRNVRQDKVLAQTLLNGYCGEKSELTTVLQYAHHSLKCKNRAQQIYNTLRGIFYVETLHLELLGECAARLGGDVEYMLALKEKSVCWQASLVEYSRTPMQMLKDDIQGERFAVDFYTDTARSVKQHDISALLSRLAEDEKLHVKLLTDLSHRIR